jgi:hypothetical protein
MGVECSAVSGFGFLLKQDEIEACLRKLSVEWDHDEPHLELSDRYDLPEPKRMGSCYRENGVEYLYFAEQVRNPETGSTTTNPEQLASLKNLIEECGLDTKPAFHEGELWH